MEEIDQVLQEELNTMVSDIGTQMRSQNLVVTGKTLSQIEAKVNNGVGEILAPPHLAMLETGRGPAKGGSDNGEFMENLKAWIVAKGLTFENEEQLQRLAKYLKWHINKFGTKQFRNQERKDIITGPINSFKERLPKKISQILHNKIKTL